ncbi:MAG TPA: SRPBCC family protein [Solirubrobacteraceae bacterium]|jgi:carbon monoxide dehydrogenase subunit G|nr:SRPBCC family protein [Solirubrobacteraceae bacterium]
MKLDQSFEVKAPLPEVWEALIDVERVAPCLPGAEITERSDDGVFKGTFSVKLGPTTAAYNGTLKMESADEASHTAVMRANGSDKRGQGGAKAQITSVLSEGDGGATKVDVSTDFTITGRLARFGRGGMVQDVSNRLLREFASCLQQNLESSQPAAPHEPRAPEPRAPAAEPSAEPSAAASQGAASSSSPPQSASPTPAPAPMRPASSKPVGGLRLMLGALWDRLRRLFGRGR